ncbi:hypothetical protein IWW38_003957, partial [Coemansia aciculifera]
MWEDEVYFDDDEAAMEAYKAAVKGDGNASDDDDDDDFQPEKPTSAALNARSAAGKSRRPPALSKGKQAAGSRQRVAATKPRKPRASAIASSRSSSPGPSSLPVLVADQAKDDNDDDAIDIDGDSSGGLSALPAPDIGKLKMSSGSTSGSPRSEYTHVSAAMEVDGDNEKT